MSQSDIIHWPDGMWCFRSELAEFDHKSDDYETLQADTIAWDKFLDKHSPEISQVAPAEFQRQLFKKAEP